MDPVVLRQHARWMSADLQTPISLYLGLVGQAPGLLLESAEVDGHLGRHSLLAWDFRLCLTCRDGRLQVQVADPRLAACAHLQGQPFLPGVRQLLSALTLLPADDFRLPPITRALYGYLGYGLASHFEPRLARLLPPQEAEACLVLPGKVVLYDHLRHRCCFLSLEPDGPPRLRPADPEEPPQVGEVAVMPDQTGYMAAVDHAKELIRQGECIQTVLSTAFTAPFAGEPLVLYRRLRQLNPSPYMFFQRLPGITLVGSSPELLVRCQGGKLETRPLAGTRPRGATEEADAALAQELLADPKERAEHVMLVDLGRNDLGRMARPGSVRVERFMAVERFSHVMHLTSTVTAELRPGLDALDVLAAAFPAGTLSGAPKVRAMEIIADLEATPRGPYGGCVCWLGLDGQAVHVDTGILIRSLWIRQGRVEWRAGAGIVHDSVAANEWRECLAKAQVIGNVLAGGGQGDVFAA